MVVDESESGRAEERRAEEADAYGVGQDKPVFTSGVIRLVEMRKKRQRTGRALTGRTFRVGAAFTLATLLRSTAAMLRSHGPVTAMRHAVTGFDPWPGY